MEKNIHKKFLSYHFASNYHKQNNFEFENRLKTMKENDENYVSLENTDLKLENDIIGEYNFQVLLVLLKKFYLHIKMNFK